MNKKNYEIYFVIKYFLLILILTLTSASNSQVIKESEITAFDIYSRKIKSTADDLKFERIPLEFGLSSTLIRTVFQDSYGFIWFGSGEGLSRFDGYTVKLYKYKINDSNSIPDIEIRTIFEDKEKTLWIGTKSGDVAKYDRERDRFVTLTDESSIPSDALILNIIEDKDGNLLIGTNRTGIKLFKKKDNSFKDYFESNRQYDSLFPQNNVLRMLFIDDSRLLFGSYQGLGIYNLNDSSIIKFSHDSLNKNSLSNNHVRCIFKDSRDRYFIGTADGLNIFNTDDYTFQVYKIVPDERTSSVSNNVLQVCEDKNNEIWIGYSMGLYKFNNDGIIQLIKNDTNDPNSNLQNNVIPFVDRSNVLWIANSGGIIKLDCERKKFHTLSKIFESSLNNYEVTTSSIYIDPAGSIWIGVRFRDGIFRFRKDLNGLLKFKEYFFVTKEIDSPVMLRMISDNRSNLWMVYYSGGYFVKCQVDKKKNIIYDLSPTRATDLCLLGNNILITAENRRGILNFDINKAEFVNIASNYSALDKLPKDNYSLLFIDSKNDLWIGSDSKGLFQYNFNQDVLSNYKKNNDNSKSISGNEIYSINEDSKNNLWLGTEAGGIDKFDKSVKIFTRYDFSNGLNSTVNGILEDNIGYLWFSSSDGLYKFDPVKLTVRLFDSDDGALSYGFSRNVCAKDKDGVLYFGGSNGGLTYFNPVEIKDNPYIPNIVITDFKIFNEAVKPSPENPFLKKNLLATKDITLSYKESVFSFDFAALIYNNSSKNQYAYMMEGFDKEWVYCGTRRNVTYTNLDPGEYTFRVKGSNNDGIWNEEGTSIKITITPPWWQTWWFKSCGAAIIFLTVGFGYKKRMSKLKKEKEVQEEYSRKLLASQEEERKRIANELHDSIAHDILILKNTADFAMNNTKEEKTKNELIKISDQSTETLNDVRNISYKLHPHQIEALGITKAIRSIIDKSSGSSKVNFIHDIENIDKIFTEENEVHIFRIVQEAISNIIKYSDSPEAIVKISCIKKSVSILISDIGKGFDFENVEKGSLGLSGISERVKILAGTLSIESKRGEGTVMKIVIPVFN